MTAGLGVETDGGAPAGPGPGRAPAGGRRRRALVDGVAEVADRLDAVLTPLAGRRVLTGGGNDPSPGSPQELAAVLELAGGRLGALNGALRRASNDGSPTLYGRRRERTGRSRATTTGPRRNRTVLAAGHLVDDLSHVIGLGDEQVAWVETSGPRGARRRRCAGRRSRSDPSWRNACGPASPPCSPRPPCPLDSRPPGPPGAHHRPPGRGQPLPLRDAAPCCTAPTTCPTARSPEAARRPARGAGLAHHGRGRTHPGPVHELAGHAGRRRRPAPRAPLPRSWPRTTCPRPSCSTPSPRTTPPASSPPCRSGRGSTCPGATLSLVTLDRLPFPRPDDPLLEARRERAGAGAFRRRRPAPGHHPAGPGGGPAHPVVDRHRGGGRPRPSSGHRQLPPAP